MLGKKPLEYSGEHATVSWHGQLCIHVGQCGRAQGQLFVAGREHWGQRDDDAAEEVRDVVFRGPGGTLVFEMSDGSHAEPVPACNSITVSDDGPLFVPGGLAFDGAPANVPGLQFRAALCRCGKSANTRICDNCHEDVAFTNFAAAGEKGPGCDELGWPLKIPSAKVGPLLVKGNASIVSDGGQEAWQGKQVATCRCRESRKRPFCGGQLSDGRFLMVDIGSQDSGANDFAGLH